MIYVFFLHLGYLHFWKWRGYNRVYLNSKLQSSHFHYSWWLWTSPWNHTLLPPPCTVGKSLFKAVLAQMMLWLVTLRSRIEIQTPFVKFKYLKKNLFLTIIYHQKFPILEKILSLVPNAEIGYKLSIDVI